MSLLWIVLGDSSCAKNRMGCSTNSVDIYNTMGVCRTINIKKLAPNCYACIHVHCVLSAWFLGFTCVVVSVTGW